MRLRTRFAGALGSPRKLFWLGTRAAAVLLRGQLRDVLARNRSRGVTDREYQRWCDRRLGNRVPADTDAIDRVLVVIDCGDQSTNADVIAANLPLHAVLGPVFSRMDAGGWARKSNGAETPGTATFDEALAELSSRNGWLIWVTAPCTLDPAFGRELCAAAGAWPDAQLAYIDEDRLDAAGGRVDPRFKPAWDREQILERNYLGPVIAIRARAVDAHTFAVAPGAPALWAFLIRKSWEWEPRKVLHIPCVLVHRLDFVAGRNSDRAIEAIVAPALAEALEQRNERAVIEVAEETSRIRYAPLPAGQRVSIVIPTRDRADLLMHCVDTIIERTHRPDFELVLVDNGSVQAAAREYLTRISATVPTIIVDDPAPFNFARLCNRGVASATGEIVVLLNNDAWMIDDNWLDELSALARRPGTGAVGPLVVYGDGMLQSAGIFVGVNRIATSALAGFEPDSPAAQRWCRSRRRVSAVLGACLAVERRKYLAIHGMDERYAVSLNEIDFCLRLEQLGLANVFTPHVRVAHVEGATRGHDLLPQDRRRLALEEKYFRVDWPGLFAAADPAHNPNLCRAGNPFDIDFSVARCPARNGWRQAGGHDWAAIRGFEMHAEAVPSAQTRTGS